MKKNCFKNWSAKIRFVFTLQNFLFVYRIVQSILRHSYIRLALVAVAVHCIASTQNKSNQQKNLAIKKKPGGGHPVVCKIFVFVINNFRLHSCLFSLAKIRLAPQKKLFRFNNFRKPLPLVYKILPYHTPLVQARKPAFF